MKKGLSVILMILFAVCANADLVSEKVFCKAKYQSSAEKAPIFSDLKLTHQDENNEYYGTTIKDLSFEIKSPKTVFFFQPWIRTADGIEISGQGYFPENHVIRLDFKRKNNSTVADIRCCLECTFSDWPK